ncbi:MAG: HAD family hydrolase [Armatimonadota bacterium]|nr:HAD family hydrolase [Armatimonadota bacterium]MDR7518148.1 HAD family hydrolase [Armatimonadota bacterium]MDR7550293.1 HAD family hydrolase [Armatimonadota bacterium]
MRTENRARVEELFRSYLPDVTIKAGAAEAIDGLAAGGYHLGVISNAAHGPFISWALADGGLLARFDRIVVSADVGIRKPWPQIFHAALGPMGLAPAEGLYVGNDYIRDVMGAKLAGLRAIWIPASGDRDYRAYTRVHPDAVSDRLEQLPDLVKSLDRLERAEEISPADGGRR